MMRIYFGKVYIDGLEKIPRDKPLILAANHQSAFIEPVLLGATMPFPVHFITRGDIFVKKWMWFFNAVNMIPIFRFHDGYSQLKKNKSSFEHVYSALEKNARIIIFCEGQMKWEKKLHPLQLGAARMAVGAYDQNRELDVHVVPIGINYEDHLTFRRYVRISIGDIIRVKDHAEGLDKSQRPALKSVTQALKENLQPHVIDISSENHFDLGNKLLCMHDNVAERRFFPLVARNQGSTAASIAAASKTHILDTNDDVEKKAKKYVDAVDTAFPYRDYVLFHETDFTILKRLFFFLFIVPLGFIGTILNGAPVVLANYVTKTRTTIPEFIGSLKSNLSSTLYFFYAVIVLIIFSFISIKWVIAALVLFPITGLFATYMYDQWPYWKAKSFWSGKSKEEKQTLLQLRSDILSSID